MSKMEIVLADRDGPVLLLMERYPGAEIYRVKGGGLFEIAGAECFVPARSLLAIRDGEIVGGAIPAGELAGELEGGASTC